MSPTGGRPETLSPERITTLLEAAGDGDRAAFDRLIAAAYDELKAIAAQGLIG